MTAATIPISPAAVRRILVCQQRQIGDVLLATPGIALLARRFPQAEIDLFTEKKALPVVQGHPDIARIHAIDKKAQRGPAAQFGFYLAVARRRYDLVVDFQQLPRIRWVVALARLFPPASGTRQVRLTYQAPWYNRWLYTHTVHPRDGYAAMAKASVLAPLGIEWDGEPPALHLSTAETDRADAILREHGISPDDVLVTVDPTHRRFTRRWPAASWGRTIALAAQHDPRYRFLVLYGPGEESIAEEVAATARTPQCVVTREMLSIREMAACIKRARLHFGSCSAPRHIATAVGVPTLGVLGSTSTAWTYPGPGHDNAVLGLDCQPCNENECPKGTTACLRDLAPEAVLPQLLDALDRAGEAAPCA